MRFFALFLFVLSLNHHLHAQNSKRLALVDVESEALSSEDKSIVLSALRTRLLDVRPFSLIQTDELTTHLQQQNPVRGQVERVRADQENKRAEIERSLEEAQKYYLASQFEEAITLLNGALLALNSAAMVMTPDLPLEILKLLAASHFFQGNEPQARYHLSALLDLDPDSLLNTLKFPPAFIDLFNQIKSDTRVNWVSLQLPSNAKQIRGQFMGRSLEVTNAETVGIRLPLHHPFWTSKAAVLEAEGYAPIVFILSKPPQSLQFVSLENKKSGTKGLFRPIGNSTPSIELKRFLGSLKPDILFLGSAERNEKGLWNLEGQWLEQPSGRTSPVVRSEAVDAASAVEILISEMLDYVAPDGMVLGEKFVSYDERPEFAAGKPFYKTWWFWTIAGAAAVGLGVGSYFLFSPSDTVKVRVSPAP